MVAVPFHKSGQTYPPKTFKKMLECQAKWTLGDLKRLKLVAKGDPWFSGRNGVRSDLAIRHPGITGHAVI